MSNEIEPNETAEVEESAEAVLPLQEVASDEADVQAHSEAMGSTVSLAACA